MTVLAGIAAVMMFGLLQYGPSVLSGDDIGDDHDVLPVDMPAQRVWLGLFVTNTTSPAERPESRLQPTRLSVVTRKASGRTIYRISTTPPDAALLVSAVPGVSAGPVTTLGRFIDLALERRDVAFRLGDRLYTVRLESTVPDLCDSVIRLAVGDAVQRLFDAAQPGTTREPGLVVECNDPHFRIHWAGDMDRDGRLDLLATFSHRYSYFPTQLLLSSAARSPDLVGEAAYSERFAQ